MTPDLGDVGGTPTVGGVQHVRDHAPSGRCGSHPTLGCMGGRWLLRRPRSWIFGDPRLGGVVVGALVGEGPRWVYCSLYHTSLRAPAQVQRAP